MRVAIALKDAFRVINHGPTTLVTTCEKDGSGANVMAAAWAMPLDFDPPKVAVVIATGTHTRALLDRHPEFVLSVPTVALANETYKAGSISGKDVKDKWAACALESEPASKVKPPLVKGCAGWLECRALDEPGVKERYDLVIAEVLAAWVDDACWEKREWRFAKPEQRTIHHLARGTFFATGDRIETKK